MTNVTRRAEKKKAAAAPYETDCNENSSAQELAECSEATRRNLSVTLDQVEARISPHRLMDDIKAYAHQNFGGVGSLSDLNRLIAKNPTPFVALGVGLIVGGAGIAAYSFYKIRSTNQGSGRERMMAPKKWQHTVEPVQEMEPGVTIQPEDEAVIPPRSAESIVTGMDEQANTEDISTAEPDYTTKS